jgi:serine/threonine-protein kinase haspin
MSTNFPTEKPVRPREKVYGRRRNGPLQDRDANLQLFAGIGTNEIEKGIASLSMSEIAVKPGTECKESQTRIAAIKRSNDVCRYPSQSDKKEIPTEKHGSRRERPGRRGRLKRATLTKEEATHLEPVLAFERTESIVYDFESWSSFLSNNFMISKLSEGSYSDCFICRKQAPNAQEVVLKIIPFRCKANRLDKIATDAQGFLREVKVLSALEPYHGFAQIYNSRVVKGKMAQNLVEAAESWLETTTEDVDKTIDPATRYADDQLFGVIEMEFAGRDLEILTHPSAFQAFDAFWMTAILIANAENSIQFEHRDLHMSNICFKQGSTGRDDADPKIVRQMEEIPSTILGLSGLDVNIIDYTHSRMTGLEGKVLYNPDPPFTSEELEEFGTERTPYDQMDTVIKADKWMQQHARQQADGRPRYADFTPRTNVIWLSHVLNELVKHGTKDPRKACIKGSSHTAKSLQIDIWKRLKGVLAIIGSSDLESLPAGTEDFIKLAVDQDLISQGDVDAFKARLNADSTPSS